MTKRRIEIGVGSLSQALDRFERTWDLARKGKARGTEVRLSFESLPLLLSKLTPAKWVLIEQLKREGPLSISGLARRLGRNYKNVHTDVSRLIEFGLVDCRDDQRVEVSWDVVTAEMCLAA